MHFLHHNFYSNFTASIQAGESDMTKDIFINELSDFIVYDTARLIEAMTKAGLDVSTKDSDEEIIEVIYKSLGNNQKLANALAFIIAEANQLINNGKTGGEESKAIIKELASGILIVGKDIRNDEVAKEFKTDVLEHIHAKAKVKGDYKRNILRGDKSFNKIAGYVVLGSFFALGLTIFFIYRAQRKSELAGLLAVASAPLTPMPDATLGTGGIVPPVAGATEVIPPVTTPITPTPIVPPVTPIVNAPSTPQVIV